MSPWAKISIPQKEGIIEKKKNSDEHCVYESVDNHDDNISGYILKNRRKK